MPLTINITEKAATKARHFAEKQGINRESFGLRIGVKGGGCSGMEYVLDIQEIPNSDDQVVEHEGVRILIDKRSYVFLAGMTLDFSDGLNGKGFTFSNPNAKSTCGCGTSFSPKTI